MPDIVRGPVWTLSAPAGWTVRPHKQAPRPAPHEDPCVALVARADDAALRLFTYYDERCGSAEEATRIAARFAPRLGCSSVEQVRCGEFAGYAASQLDGDWWRHWWLAAGPVPLDIVYVCDSPVTGRDDAAVEAMLATLRARPLAYELRRMAFHVQDAPSRWRLRQNLRARAAANR
jgi:hypothetical protein